MTAACSGEGVHVMMDALSALVGFPDSIVPPLLVESRRSVVDYSF
jgi:hypothetical protein